MLIRFLGAYYSYENLKDYWAIMGLIFDNLKD